MEDEFDLPALDYTCDPTADPLAVTPINPSILGKTEHIHRQSGFYQHEMGFQGTVREPLQHCLP
jgi:hypothetical protein